jgi:hypothetical protein
MTRIRLPNRRASSTLEFTLGELHYTCSYSLFTNGQIGELFLQNHKAGSQSDANARDSAVAASLALQFGCPLGVLRDAVLRNPDGAAATPLGAALDIIARENAA